MVKNTIANKSINIGCWGGNWAQWSLTTSLSSSGKSSIKDAPKKLKTVWNGCFSSARMSYLQDSVICNLCQCKCPFSNQSSWLLCWLKSNWYFGLPTMTKWNLLKKLLYSRIAVFYNFQFELKSNLDEEANTDLINTYSTLCVIYKMDNKNFCILWMIYSLHLKVLNWILFLKI